jgi:hypothetical protein
MKLQGISVVMAAIALAAAPARAEKIPPEFRSAFEGKVRKGAYAVVVQKGVPTTSIYGVNGDQTDAFYAVDIKGGEWRTSEGWLDLNQVAADSLVLGEVMEVVDVTFKDARIDLRMVSLEAHKVTRGSGFSKSTKREPVSTNFKFFFPFAVRTAQDLPQALEYVEAWLRVFPSESAARAFSAQTLAGGVPAGPSAAEPARAAGAPPAAAAAPTTTKKELKVGMSMLEVIDILGKPQKEVAFESKTRWSYPDLTVIFVNGRVTQVQF